MPLIALSILLTCGLTFFGTLTSCASAQSPNVEVQFVTPRVGWIVGPRLLQTTDAGRTWVELRREGYGTLEAEDIFQGRNWMQFVNPEVGFSVGGSGIAKTSDGGRTWQSVVVTEGGDQSLRSLFFISPREGWVVGTHVYYTDDGGSLWTRLSESPVGDESKQRSMGVAPTYAISNPALWFSDSKRGWMARLDGEVYRTGDGGRTWEIAWQTNKGITDLFFINGQNGWLVGSEGLVARTVDGGQTWSAVPTPAKADLTSVFFINKQTGCSGGHESTILCTKDGGATWKQASINGRSGSLLLAAVAFSDETHGWAVGGTGEPRAHANVVLTTDDGGQTWRAIDP